MSVTLSEGAIEAMCEGNTDISPVLQVWDVRPVNSPANLAERHRLMLWDGVHLQQGVLATQLNDLVKTGRLQKGSVIHLLHFVCNKTQNRTIIIVIELQLLKEAWPIIGEPKQYGFGGERPAAQAQPFAGQRGVMDGNAQPRSPHGHPSGNAPTVRPSAAGGLLQQPKLESGQSSWRCSRCQAATIMESGRYMTNNNAPPMHPKPSPAPLRRLLLLIMLPLLIGALAKLTKLMLTFA